MQQTSLTDAALAALLAQIDAELAASMPEIDAALIEAAATLAEIEETGE